MLRHALYIVSSFVNASSLFIKHQTDSVNSVNMCSEGTFFDDQMSYIINSACEYNEVQPVTVDETIDDDDHHVVPLPALSEFTRSYFGMKGFVSTFARRC